MDECQSLADCMRFLGYSFVFSQTQPLLYDGVQTKVLDSQILSAQKVVELLRKEQRYGERYKQRTSIKEAAETERLHRDLNPVLEMKNGNVRWRDRLPEIIETIETVSLGKKPEGQIANGVKPFFKDMLHYCALKEHEFDSSLPFL